MKKRSGLGHHLEQVGKVVWRTSPTHDGSMGRVRYIYPHEIIKTHGTVGVNIYRTRPMDPSILQGKLSGVEGEIQV